MNRTGMGKGRGVGYYNIAPMDSHIHSLSAKGIKTKLCPCKTIKKTFGLNAVDMKKEMTVSEKISYDLTKVAKDIKDQLKKDYPNTKWSLRVERYSMGESLHVSLMESDFKVIMDFDDIPEDELLRRYNRSNHWVPFEKYKEQQRQEQEKGYHQLNGNIDEYGDGWNNGVFLTKEGHEMMKKVMNYTHHYNWNNSDVQTDYFDVNFYTHLNIGKWDKPFVQQGKVMKND